MKNMSIHLACLVATVTMAVIPLTWTQSPPAPAPVQEQGHGFKENQEIQWRDGSSGKWEKGTFLYETPGGKQPVILRRPGDPNSQIACDWERIRARGSEDQPVAAEKVLSPIPVPVPATPPAIMPAMLPPPPVSPPKVPSFAPAAAAADGAPRLGRYTVTFFQGFTRSPNLMHYLDLLPGNKYKVYDTSGTNLLSEGEYATDDKGNVRWVSGKYKDEGYGGSFQVDGKRHQLHMRDRVYARNEPKE